jgi:hypothetical protein
MPHAPKPVPTITHKVIPAIIHKMVPTITDEVEVAPAQTRTAPEAAAPAPVKPAPQTPAPAPVKAVHAAPTPQAAPASIVAVPAPPPPARRVEVLDAPLPNLECTQTLRPLTKLELDDSSASRWFVIQLSLAEEGFDPDSLPNLDIFNEYRLYSVAGLDQGKVMHALRVGFFADEVAAAAVASYLAAFYEKPAIKRISMAERDRFSDQRVEARKDVGATGRHAVIEITNERVVRGKRTSATVTPMPARPTPASQAAGRSGK